MEEEYISVGDKMWYETDLQLAAELGKTLLERNKDLETQLFHAQQHLHDQAAEIEFLNHQLETLRDLNESRVKVFDEVEKHATETEKTNNRLAKEVKADKEKIDRLTHTVEILEERNVELENSLQEQKQKEHQRIKRESRTRTLSVPSITDALRYGSYWAVDIHELAGFNKLPLNPYEAEIQRLQQTIKHLRSQKVMEDRKKAEFESELGIIVQENQEFQYKLRDYEQLKKKVRSLEMEVEEIQKCSTKLRKQDSENEVTEPSVDTNNELIAEHDDPQSNSCEVLKLKNGGSAYGSRESLNKVGLQSHDSPNSQTACLPGESLLSELNSQYMFLVRKYESMLEAKRNATVSTASLTEGEMKPSMSSTEMQASAVTSHREVQTTRNFQLEFNLEKKSRSLDYEQDPPEYRKIFKEIFETLRKTSAIHEEK